MQRPPCRNSTESENKSRWLGDGSRLSTSFIPIGSIIVSPDGEVSGVNGAVGVSVGPELHKGWKPSVVKHRPRYKSAGMMQIYFGLVYKWLLPNEPLDGDGS